jgi:curved DNA-binding protein CbpA
MNKGDDPYAILGVTHDAELSEIKRCYRKLALKYHPDKTGDDPDAASKFAKVANAYEILSDPLQREQYDIRQRCSRGKGYDPNARYDQNMARSTGSRRPNGSPNATEVDESDSRHVVRTETKTENGGTTTTTYYSDGTSQSEWISSPMPRSVRTSKVPSSTAASQSTTKSTDAGSDFPRYVTRTEMKTENGGTTTITYYNDGTTRTEWASNPMPRGARATNTAIPSNATKITKQTLSPGCGTTSYTYMGDPSKFSDPMEMFKRMFKDDFDAKVATSPPGSPVKSPSIRRVVTTTSSPKVTTTVDTSPTKVRVTKVRKSKNGDILPSISLDGAINDSSEIVPQDTGKRPPKSMSSKTSTITHEDGRVETIVETTVIHADGSKETKFSRQGAPASTVNTYLGSPTRTTKQTVSTSVKTLPPVMTSSVTTVSPSRRSDKGKVTSPLLQ